MSRFLQHIMLWASAVVILLTAQSCYDLNGMGRNPYELDDNTSDNNEKPSGNDGTRYADINIDYTISAQDSANLKSVL